MEAFLKLLSDNVSGYSGLPTPLQYFLPMLLACLCCIALVALFPIVAVYAERKVAAHMQDRLGPMRVGGWHGWAQTIADGIKLLLKEDIIPSEADRLLFKLAPLVVQSLGALHEVVEFHFHFPLRFAFAFAARTLADSAAAFLARSVRLAGVMVFR